MVTIVAAMRTTMFPSSVKSPPPKAFLNRKTANSAWMTRNCHRNTP